MQAYGQDNSRRRRLLRRSRIVGSALVDRGLYAPNDSMLERVQESSRGIFREWMLEEYL